jgi:hypothetical protein
MLFIEAIYLLRSSYILEREGKVPGKKRCATVHIWQYEVQVIANRQNWQLFINANLNI